MRRTYSITSSARTSKSAVPRFEGILASNLRRMF